MIEALLSEHLPGVEVWAYGSRVDGRSHDGSDLALVLRGPGLQEIPVGQVADFEEAVGDSSIPFLVEARDWAWLPERYQREIERGYVVLVGAEQKSSGVRMAWRDLPFSDAGTVNPSVRLERGKSYPFVDMAAINVGCRSISASQYREFQGGGTRFQSGDTLMARITPCLENGKIARYCASDTTEVAHGSTEFIVIRGRPGITDTEYAHYLTQWEEVRNYAVGQMTGTSGRQRVPVDSLDHLIVPIPPLTEQRAIAHILGTLDDKVELNRRMNETLEGMARALFKSWFVDFDPVRAKAALRGGRDWSVDRARAYLDRMDPEIAALFPDRFVDSELREIPAGWGVGVLDDMVELLSGGTPRTAVPNYWDGDIPWYTAKDAPALSDVFVLATERTITQAGVENSAAKILPAGTTVITARGTVGRLACLGVPMAMNQTCYGIQGFDGYPDYFTYWSIRAVVDELQRRTHGTIFDTITRQTFKLVETTLAPVDVVQAFEATVMPVMARILKNLNESRALAALRDALLPKLVSGELQANRFTASEVAPRLEMRT